MRVEKWLAGLAGWGNKENFVKRYKLFFSYKMNKA